MRTILSLVLAFGVAGGITTLSGCEKKATSEHKTTDTQKTPEGGSKTTETETKTTETPPKAEK